MLRSIYTFSSTSLPLPFEMSMLVVLHVLRSDKNVEGQFREFQKKRKGEFGRLRKVIVQNDSHE